MPPGEALLRVIFLEIVLILRRLMCSCNFLAMWARLRLVNRAGGGSWLPALRPVPVGTFPPNAFGLYDMAGNVLEWVQDCWKSDYSGLPANARIAYEPIGCLRRVHRGGAWESSAAGARSAARTYALPLFSEFTNRVGFRIARTLD